MFAAKSRLFSARERALATWSVVLRVWLCLVLLGVLASSVSAAERTFKFAWLSDTHVGSSTAADDLRASVNDINEMKDVRFVVVSGDVTEYGSLTQLKRAKEILDDLEVPYHILPGNHDTKWSESGATDFGRLWKADRFVFDHGGVRFIGLHQGPLMKMGDGHWAPQDVRWLETKLKSIKADQPVIFVTHYPVDTGIANWFVVLDMLKRHNVQVVLCGHGHSSRKLSFEGVPGVMGRSNLRAKQPVGGFNLVEVGPERMTFSERVTGQETKAPWHELPRLAGSNASSSNAWPRPDFSVNTRYPAVRPEWVFDSGWTISSSAAVYEDLGIVGDASGTVYGLALDSGQVRWRFKTRNAVYSTPEVAGSRVVVPSTDGRVYALDARTGRKLWQMKTPRPIVASPVADATTVYVGASDGTFRALDLATGKQRWEFNGVEGFVETRPLLYAGKVIFGAWDEQLYALDTQTGALAWKWRGDRRGDLLSPAACWPVGARDKVFIVAPDRQMTALEAATGRQVWRTGDYVVRESIGLSADSSRFYVRAMNDFIYAFNTSGDAPEKIWERNAGFGYDINSGMLRECQGMLFYGTKNGLLLALDAATGAIAWQHKLGTGVMNTVTPLSDTRVLVTDFDGKVALIRNRAP